MTNLPMYTYRQHFPARGIDSISDSVAEALASAGLPVAKGARIAVTVGSRGIANLKEIVRAAVSWLRRSGAEPFIIPAMGSHGGATAEGQVEVLASYGITQNFVGAEILSSMEAVELPSDGLENRVFMDRNAWESDGVLLINRAKVHTDYHGRWESGLAKMAVIGLGKQKQAEEIHSFGIHGLRDLIPKTAKAVLSTGKIIGGLGIAEDAYDNTMEIKVATADGIMEMDAQLLELARAAMPKLPVDDIDVLIIDEMGKDKSGTGVDTNIVGRIKIRGEEEPVTPRISSVVILDITEASHGNAIGVGLGDVITKKLFDKIDFEATNQNAITSSFLERCKIPLIAESDDEAVAVALRAAGCRNVADARIIRIKSTLELSELAVSEALVPEMEALDHVKKTGSEQA